MNLRNWGEVRFVSSLRLILNMGAHGQKQCDADHTFSYFYRSFIADAYRRITMRVFFAP